MKTLNILVAAVTVPLCCASYAQTTAAPARESTIAIMTFNIWHDGKAGKQPLSQTAKVIRMAKADIVGLQEVKKSAKALADMLGWYHVQQGGDTAVLSRFKIIGTTENKLGVKIRSQSGQEIVVFNVHLMHAPYQPYQLLNIPYCNAPFLKTEAEAIAAAKKARGHQVRDLIKEINDVKEKDTPVFITGDFNEPSHLDWTQAAAESGRHPLKVLYPTTLALEKKGFTDAYRTVYPNEIKQPGFTWTPRTKPDNPKDHHDRIDFVLCNRHGVKVVKAELVGENQEHADIVVTPYPSDHRAMVATFTIAPGPAKTGKNANKPDTNESK